MSSEILANHYQLGHQHCHHDGTYPEAVQNLPNFFVDGQGTKLHTLLMGGHKVAHFIDGEGTKLHTL